MTDGEAILDLDSAPAVVPMSPMWRSNPTPPINAAQDQYEGVLGVLAATTFITFFQAFMVAPLIPRLATVFATTEHAAGLVVP